MPAVASARKQRRESPGIDRRAQGSTPSAARAQKVLLRAQLRGERCPGTFQCWRVAPETKRAGLGSSSGPPPAPPSLRATVLTGLPPLNRRAVIAAATRPQQQGRRRRRAAQRTTCALPWLPTRGGSSHDRQHALVASECNRNEIRRPTSEVSDADN
ncbi:hypothetical protein MTO96_010314 [Rhipicephalus appendiculatus]